MDERRRRIEEACAIIEARGAVPEAEPAAPSLIKAEASPDAESTSDNRERLLWDVLDFVGPLGQAMRESSLEWDRRKGAELIALWRRGEHLGVLREERP